MKKVSLRELVADKIVFAALIAVYYWMWARNDWQESYATIQDVVFAFSFYYFVNRAIRLKKYKQEAVDEMAETNLKRCDSICLKIGAAAMIVIGFVCAVGRMVLTTEIIGYALMGTLAALAVITIALGCVILFGKFDSIMLLAGISLIVDGVFDLIATLAFSKRVREARQKLHMYMGGPIIDSEKVDD